MGKNTHQSKRSKSEVAGKAEDRISNLPEHVLAKILDCLTTKQAVQTSVLSKYWESMWTSTSNVIVDDSEFYCWKNHNKKDHLIHQGKSFSNFVEKSLHAILTNVIKFHLSCWEKDGVIPITTWISTIFSLCKVKSVHVYCPHEGINISSNLFNCSSLRDLDLRLPCTLKAPAYSLLPNLTALHLCKIIIQNESSNTDTLRFSFPTLETFVQCRCIWLDVKSVEFYAPSLTTFTCENYNELHDYSIKIVGANLKYFESEGTFLNVILRESQVERADIHQTLRSPPGEFGLQVRNLLREISNANKLRIKSEVLLAMGQSKAEPRLQEFYKLEHLILSCIPYVSTLFELLEARPSLKFLEINMYDGVSVGVGVGDSEDDDDYADANDYDNASALKCVPSCFIHSLETVEFWGFAGESNQCDIAKFVMKNGLKLKNAHFYVWFNCEDKEKKNFEEELSTYPRGSPCLELFVS